jgi:hypothetical protein
MGQQNDEPTAEEIARAKEILARESEKLGAQQGSQLPGVWGMALQMLQMLPGPVIIGGLVVFLGYHAWDYYNAARRDPAETQEIMAKAGTAQVDYNAQNAPAGDDTVRGAAVRAEMDKLKAEAAAAKATTDALTQQINGLTAAQGLKRAELEKLANEAQTAGAEARAANALLMEQRKAELAKTRADARMAEWSADYVAGNMPNGRAKGDLFDAFGLNGKPPQTQPAPRRVQEAARETPAPAPEPERKPSSFDCTKAFLGVDFVVCANPQLLAAEAELEGAYRLASVVGGDRVKIAQRAWIKSYGPGCGLPAKGQPSAAQMTQSRACVLNAINQRINDLNNGV